MQYEFVWNGFVWDFISQKLLLIGIIQILNSSVVPICHYFILPVIKKATRPPYVIIEIEVHIITCTTRIISLDKTSRMYYFVFIFRLIYR